MSPEEGSIGALEVDDFEPELDEVVDELEEEEELEALVECGS